MTKEVLWGEKFYKWNSTEKSVKTRPAQRAVQGEGCAGLAGPGAGHAQCCPAASRLSPAGWSLRDPGYRRPQVDKEDDWQPSAELTGRKCERELGKTQLIKAAPATKIKPVIRKLTNMMMQEETKYWPGPSDRMRKVWKRSSLRSTTLLLQRNRQPSNITPALLPRGTEKLSLGWAGTRPQRCPFLPGPSDGSQPAQWLPGWLATGYWN